MLKLKDSGINKELVTIHKHKQEILSSTEVNIVSFLVTDLASEFNLG